MRASRWLGFLLLASCGGGDSAPTWRHLAQGFRPQVKVETERSWRPNRGSEEALQLRQDPDGNLWVGMRVPSSAWSHNPRTGAWFAPRRFIGQGMPSSGEPPAKLLVDGTSTSFQNFSIEAGIEAMLAGERRIFCMAGDRIHAVGTTLTEPPPTAVLWQYVSLGEAENGRWRGRLGPVTADAIVVLPGFAQEVRSEVPANTALHFTTLGQEYDDGGRGPTGELSFRVLVDGELVHESKLAVGSHVTTAHQRILLPAEGAREARFTFEVDGPAALAAFVSPVIGPADVGRYGKRPWEARPDVLLLLADTFRADNMAAYGGDPKLTPFLDRLASDSLLFERVWSTSTWTLPTHAAIFSGYLPSQSGVTGADHALAPEAITLAEHFAAAGYRTGAITDRGFVSATYGLAQGFEWFHEALDDLAGTEDRVLEFLARDDGRPTFLFVQSYETHVPYTVSAESRQRLGGVLASAIDFESVSAEIAALPPGISFLDPTPEAVQMSERLAALYRGTAADLDRGFERILDGIGRLGLKEARIAFTSDHGEGLFEHGAHGHGNALFEEHLRIPLFLHGPGIEAGRRSDAATNIDLPRTIAALANLEPDPSWGGRNLLERTAAPPALSFQCNPRSSLVSIVFEEHKLITSAELEAIASGNVESAFDLAQDPEELRPIEELESARQRLRDIADRLEPLFEARLESAGAVLSADERSELDALGYTGD